MVGEGEEAARSKMIGATRRTRWVAWRMRRGRRGCVGVALFTRLYVRTPSIVCCFHDPRYVYVSLNDLVSLSRESDLITSEPDALIGHHYHKTGLHQKRYTLLRDEDGSTIHSRVV